MQPLDFVEVCGDFLGGQIDEPVVLRRRFDIAVMAGQVAQRAGVEPQRVERAQRHLGAGLASGGHERVAELARIRLQGG